MMVTSHRQIMVRMDSEAALIGWVIAARQLNVVTEGVAIMGGKAVLGKGVVERVASDRDDLSDFYRDDPFSF